MDEKQRLEILCQIMRDYGLVEHIAEKRDVFERRDDLTPVEVGGDLALLDAIVHGEGLYPVSFELSQVRARQRLGLIIED